MTDLKTMSFRLLYNNNTEMRISENKNFLFDEQNV